MSIAKRVRRELVAVCNVSSIVWPDSSPWPGPASKVIKHAKEMCLQSLRELDRHGLPGLLPSTVAVDEAERHEQVQFEDLTPGVPAMVMSWHGEVKRQKEVAKALRLDQMKQYLVDDLNNWRSYEALEWAKEERRRYLDNLGDVAVENAYHNTLMVKMEGG